MEENEQNLICLTVQFFHSGSEYKQSSDSGVMPWNEGTHHRKFLCAKGDYVRDGKRVEKSSLCFWGEWEPTSEFNKTGRSKPPFYTHRPFVQDKDMATGNCKNTDPFVFSDEFIYHCCLQVRKMGSTQLYSLDKGSVILFGSHIGNKFALDTVFVVAESREYSIQTAMFDLKGFVSKRNIEVAGIGHASYSGSCWGACAPHVDHKGKPVHFRCYKGATLENPINGMYSFVPCRLVTGSNAFFERPMLSHNEISFINERMKQGFKTAPNTGLDNAKQVWKAVLQLCRDQKYLEGLRFYFNNSNPTPIMTIE